MLYAIHDQRVGPTQVRQVSHKLAFMASGVLLWFSANVIAVPVAVSERVGLESGRGQGVTQAVDRPSNLVLLRVIGGEVDGEAIRLRRLVGTENRIWNADTHQTAAGKNAVALRHQGVGFFVVKVLEEVLGEDERQLTVFERQSSAGSKVEGQKVGFFVELSNIQSAPHGLRPPYQASKETALIVPEVNPGLAQEHSQGSIRQEFQTRCAELKAGRIHGHEDTASLCPLNNCGEKEAPK
jgi:hypothetical protein